MLRRWLVGGLLLRLSPGMVVHFLVLPSLFRTRQPQTLLSLPGARQEKELCMRGQGYPARYAWCGWDGVFPEFSLSGSCMWVPVSLSLSLSCLLLCSAVFQGGLDLPARECGESLFSFTKKEFPSHCHDYQRCTGEVVCAEGRAGGGGEGCKPSLCFSSFQPYPFVISHTRVSVLHMLLYEPAPPLPLS